MKRSLSKKKNIEAIYRLSPTQEGILFHTLYSPDSAVYFNQFCCTLNGNLVPAELHKAWCKTIEGHPILRTLFTWERRKKPLQIVREQVAIPWEFQDWQDVHPLEQSKKLGLLLKADRKRGFELSQAPLTRLTVIQLSSTSFRFLWSFHHIILDGWSMRLLFKDMLSIYSSLYENRQLSIDSPRPFQDYIHWLQSQDLAKAEKFWRKTLKGFTEPTRIKLNGEIKEFGHKKALYRQRLIGLSEETTARLQALARQAHVTLNTILQGAWALLLSQYSGKADIVFGATSSGRPASLEGIENMIGMFINTLPVRIQLEPEIELSTLLKEIQQAQIERNQYEYTPLVKIQHWCEVPTNHSLFESILVFENHPVDTESGQVKGGLRVNDIQYIEHSNYPLALLAVPGSRLQLIVVHDSNRFDDSTISRLFGHLLTVLETLVSSPNHQVSNLQILTKEEKHQILVEWNGVEDAQPVQQCWHQAFKANIAEVAHNTALVYKDHTLSYDQLNKQSNQIAHYLVELGVTPDTLVGIYLGRSIEMIVGLLGIMKAGGAYVPLDPMYPRERLKFMIEDMKISLLITKDPFIKKLPECECRIICLDSTDNEIGSRSDCNLETSVKPSHLAYLIYTSGSSGDPKGVMVTHKNLQHSTNARADYYKKSVNRFLLFSTYAFDSSVAGIFWTLGSGGTLYLPEDEKFMEPAYFGKLIRQHEITHLLCVPSFYEQLLKHEPNFLQSLTTMIVAGEACPAVLAEMHFELMGNTSLFNEYGPTESTVWASVFKCKKNQQLTTIPIGRPLSNIKFYVLNQYLKLVPIGVPGELYIGGSGLAKGYLNRPELDREKFIPNPITNDPQDRVYKTGDIVQFLPDGNLEFLGRTDDQVKIRGYRIELGEIANTVRKHPLVEQAVILAETEDEQQSGFHEINQSENITNLELDEVIRLMDPRIADKMVTEIESLSEADVLDRISEETGVKIPKRPNGEISEEIEISDKPAEYFKVKRENDFEIQLRIKHENFIEPPRKTQKEWLITQLLNEVADDLGDLDLVSRKFVPGNVMMNRGYITDAEHSELPEQVILEDWQIPIMKSMAMQVTETHGDILEIGFGRGVSASFIQEKGVRSHTIIECNESCINNYFEPWTQRYPEKNIKLIQGRWEEVEQDLGLFDGIFFHAFPLNDEEFIQYVVNSITFAEHFFPVAASHLKEQGIFTYLTTEINSLSRRHQRALFEYFKSITLSVESLRIPEDTKDAWWADTMVIIKAVK